MSSYIQKKSTIFILLLLLIVTASLIIQIPHLCLTDTRSGQVYFSQPLGKSDAFTMRWIHSVELEPWEEHFIIDQNGQIVLDSTRFKAFGAGVPESAGRKTEIKNGYIQFLEINQPMPDLVYGISPTAMHTLILKGKEYPLYLQIEADRGVRITVEDHNLIYQWMHQ